jgi:transposase
MMTAAPLYRLWCGLDVAAKTFTATWTTDRTHYAAPVTLPQTADGIATLHQHLQATGIPAAETLIVLESTGSYWIGLAVQLDAAGFVLSVVNPKQAYY